MKKRSLKLLLITSLSAALLAGCGNKNADSNSTQNDISENLQENYDLDEETADELAEIADEINEEEANDTQEAKEESTDAESTEADSPYYPSFKALLDNAYHIDSRFFDLDEEGLVEAYGMPDEKKSETLIWPSDDFEGFEVEMVPKYEYSMTYRDNSMFERIAWSHAYDKYIESLNQDDISISYDLVKDWFEDNGAFNNAYEYSTMESYDDFVDRFGCSGYLGFIQLGKNITVCWYIPENHRIFTQTFDIKTGQSRYVEDSAAIPDLGGVVCISEDGYVCDWDTVNQ